MANKIYEKDSYEDSQAITENQDGFLINQPSGIGVRKQKWILFSAIRAWVLSFVEFAQIAYNQAAITANKNDINNNSQAIDNNGGNINQNGNAIDQNGIDINNNSNAIGVNGQGINTNAQNINTNTQNINSNDQDINILQGRANDLENLVDQDVKNTATPTFLDVIITGLGNIKGIIQGLLDKVGQSLNPTDDVVFSSVNTGFGDNDVVPENIVHPFINFGTPQVLPSLEVKQTGIKTYKAALNSISVSMPDEAIAVDYSYSYIFWDQSEARTEVTSVPTSVGDGHVILYMDSGDYLSVTYTRLN
jgi:hypothetical protein